MKRRDLEDMSDEDLLDIMAEHDDSHFDFNNDFGESLSEWLEDHDELTDGQRSACIKIIEKHHMEY